jgi:uncharacterized membrane protein YuzA (DUF378 family)
MEKLRIGGTETEGGMMARTIDGIGWFLVLAGATNWGLVGLAEFDVVAALTGRSFGETTVLSRIIYTLIGVSAVWVAFRPLYERRRAAAPQAPQPQE